MRSLPHPVEIGTITLFEARRQQPECFPSDPRRCTTHFHACNCREHKVAVLAKASFDAAVELDWIKNVRGVTTEQRESCKQLVERIYSANAALVLNLGVSDEVAA
ncbi:MAG: hypothetical protein WC208_09750 [Gallionella sp.]|jgi:hypothetical protein